MAIVSRQPALSAGTVPPIFDRKLLDSHEFVLHVLIMVDDTLLVGCASKFWSCALSTEKPLERVPQLLVHFLS